MAAVFDIFPKSTSVVTFFSLHIILLIFNEYNLFSYLWKIYLIIN